MKHSIVTGVALLAVALVGCGGANPPGAEQTAPGQSTPGQPAPAPGGVAAPEGQIVIEVDGRTFSAPITECTVDANTFAALARDPATNLSLEARAFNLGAGWTVSASVTQDDLTYNAVSRGVTPTIAGRSLNVTVDFARGRDLPQDEVGPGQVSATCAG